MWMWHGHVVSNRNGVKAKCGGEDHCPQCRQERLVVELLENLRLATPETHMAGLAQEMINELYRLPDPRG